MISSKTNANCGLVLYSSKLGNFYAPKRPSSSDLMVLSKNLSKTSMRLPFSCGGRRKHSMC
jgi:hypothetical protein